MSDNDELPAFNNHRPAFGNEPAYEGYLPASYEKRYYFYKHEGVNKRMYIDHVIFLEARDNYVMFKFPEGDPIILRTTLEGLTRELPDGMFIRISRTHAVAAASIVIWAKDYVILEGDIALPVAKSFAEMLDQRLYVLGTY